MLKTSIEKEDSSSLEFLGWNDDMFLRISEHIANNPKLVSTITKIEASAHENLRILLQEFLGKESNNKTSLEVLLQNPKVKKKYDADEAEMKEYQDTYVSKGKSYTEKDIQNLEKNIFFQTRQQAVADLTKAFEGINVAELLPEDVIEAFPTIKNSKVGESLEKNIYREIIEYVFIAPLSGIVSAGAARGVLGIGFMESITVGIAFSIIAIMVKGTVAKTIGDPVTIQERMTFFKNNPLKILPAAFTTCFAGIIMYALAWSVQRGGVEIITIGEIQNQVGNVAKNQVPQILDVTQKPSDVWENFIGNSAQQGDLVKYIVEEIMGPEFRGEGSAGKPGWGKRMESYAQLLGNQADNLLDSNMRIARQKYTGSPNISSIRSQLGLTPNQTIGEKVQQLHNELYVLPIQKLGLEEKMKKAISELELYIASQKIKEGSDFDMLETLKFVSVLLQGGALPQDAKDLPGFSDVLEVVEEYKKLHENLTEELEVFIQKMNTQLQGIDTIGAQGVKKAIQVDIPEFTLESDLQKIFDVLTNNLGQLEAKYSIIPEGKTGDLNYILYGPKYQIIEEGIENGTIDANKIQNLKYLFLAIAIILDYIAVLIIIPFLRERAHRWRTKDIPVAKGKIAEKLDTLTPILTQKLNLLFSHVGIPMLSENEVRHYVESYAHEVVAKNATTIGKLKSFVANANPMQHQLPSTVSDLNQIAQEIYASSNGTNGLLEYIAPGFSDVIDISSKSHSNGIFSIFSSKNSEKNLPKIRVKMQQCRNNFYEKRVDFLAMESAAIEILKEQFLNGEIEFENMDAKVVREIVTDMSNKKIIASSISASGENHVSNTRFSTVENDFVGAMRTLQKLESSSRKTLEESMYNFVQPTIFTDYEGHFSVSEITDGTLSDEYARNKQIAAEAFEVFGNLDSRIQKWKHKLQTINLDSNTPEASMMRKLKQTIEKEVNSNSDILYDTYFNDVSESIFSVMKDILGEGMSGYTGEVCYIFEDNKLQLKFLLQADAQEDIFGLPPIVYGKNTSKLGIESWLRKHQHFMKLKIMYYENLRRIATYQDVSDVDSEQYISLSEQHVNTRIRVHEYQAQNTLIQTLIDRSTSERLVHVSEKDVQKIQDMQEKLNDIIQEIAGYGEEKKKKYVYNTITKNIEKKRENV